MSTAFIYDLILLVFTLGCGVCGGLACRRLSLLDRRYAGAPPLSSRLAMLRLAALGSCILFVLYGCVSLVKLSPDLASLVEDTSMQDDFHLVSDRMNLAIYRGDVATVKSMLAHGTDPNGWSWDPVEDWQHLNGSPMLTDVASSQTPSKLAIMQLLLDHGANPNVVGSFGRTAMGLAAEWGNVAGVRLLLQHGADPNLRAQGWRHGNGDWGSPLDQARRTKNQVLVRLLKQYGAHD